MPLTDLSLGPWTWVLAVVAGGLLALDAVSWPQAMVSRPLVSGTLGGWIFGDAAAGFLVGGLLELLSLRHPPFGAARYPDTGPAGLVAGGAFAAAGGTGIGPLVAALITGWGVGWIGAISVQARRRGNERLLEPVDRLAAEPALLDRRQRLAIRLDALRGALLTAGFLVPAVGVAVLATSWPDQEAQTVLGAGALLAALAAAGGAGGRITSFGLRGWPLLLAGAALGGLLVGLVG